MALPYASPADAVAADRFFAGRPESQATWEALASIACTWGPVVIVATKSRVALKARTRFLWCPQTYVDGRIVVRFLLPYPIEHERIRVDPTGSRFSMRVTWNGDADALDWFRAAYEHDL